MTVLRVIYGRWLIRRAYRLRAKSKRTHAAFMATVDAAERALRVK